MPTTGFNMKVRLDHCAKSSSIDDSYPIEPVRLCEKNEARILLVVIARTAAAYLDIFQADLKGECAKIQKIENL